MSANQLEELMLHAKVDYAAEAVFFRALLDATVYAHAPLSDDHPRLRLIQFQHPDGFLVLPFFSSIEKANVAAQGSAKVLTFKGRDFFSITRGANLILNPNDEACLLFPEEVEALVTTGKVPRIETGSYAPEGVKVGAPQAPPPWLVPILCDVYPKVASVEVAYLVQIYWPDMSADVSMLLVVIGVASNESERAARATITAVQPHAEVARTHSIDITVFDPSAPPPSYLAKLNIAPFYVRPAIGAT